MASTSPPADCSDAVLVRTSRALCCGAVCVSRSCAHLLWKPRLRSGHANAGAATTGSLVARKKVAGTKHASGVKKARREINVTMSPSPAGAEIRRTSGSSARMSLPNALRRGKSSRTNPRTMESAHLRLSRQLARAFFMLIGVPIPVYSFSAVSAPPEFGTIRPL